MRAGERERKRKKGAASLDMLLLLASGREQGWKTRRVEAIQK
jgi:hypothetical protein